MSLCLKTITGVQNPNGTPVNVSICGVPSANGTPVNVSVRTVVLTPIPGGNGTTSTSLSALTDVQIANPTAGDLLTYSSTQKWQNQQPQGVQTIDGGNF